MVTEKLDIFQTIKDGVSLGLKNFLPFLLTVILYLVTCWIPYLNVGTTVGLYKAVIALGRGEKIEAATLFDKKNFEPMSGFFLLMGLQFIGTLAAFCFMFIPGIVLAIAWNFAMYFFLDKKVSPLKSLQLSYDATLGNKWRIFFTGLVCTLALLIAGTALMMIPKVGVVLYVIAVIVWTVLYCAVFSVMYRFFSEKADVIAAGHHRGHGRCCHGANPCEDPAVETDASDTEPAPDPLSDITTEA